MRVAGDTLQAIADALNADAVPMLGGGTHGRPVERAVSSRLPPSAPATQARAAAGVRLPRRPAPRCDVSPATATQ
jgi:hypothetical protein